MSECYGRRKAELPPAYVAFIEANDGWEGFPAGGEDYVVLWERQLIGKYFENYEMDKHLDPRWFPIGSNGGGEMLCFDLASGNDAVYWLPFITMSGEDAILRYQTFLDLARRIGRSG